MTNPFPNKKYKIIYADPPWSYGDPKANRGGAVRHYATMSHQGIKDLPVQEIADTDCALLIWTTMPKIKECLEVIESWGFEYRTTAFTWVKRNKKSDGWFWGMGSWTRANPELCFLATRGKPQRQSASVHSVLDARIQQHSKKPDETRTRITELLGDLPRIELFAREQTPGWDAWGNETESMQ
jgi:N6-adenosine-specific RNA methylase IME4